MTLSALQHIIRAAQALAEDRAILVLGSASLLASFPELGNEGSLLAVTYDADLCPDPFDELTGTMLDEALGENRAYNQLHGYHADILRDSILSRVSFTPELGVLCKLNADSIKRPTEQPQVDP